MTGKTKECHVASTRFGSNILGDNENAAVWWTIMCIYPWSIEMSRNEQKWREWNDKQNEGQRSWMLKCIKYRE